MSEWLLDPIIAVAIVMCAVATLGWASLAVTAVHYACTDDHSRSEPDA